MIVCNVQLGLGALQRRDLDEPAFDRQRLDVAREVVPADHVEDDVHAGAACQLADDRDEVFVPVVDASLRAEALAGGAFLGRPGRGKHACAERARELDRRRADAARSAVNQDDSPALRRPRSKRFVQTVKNVSGMAAAATKSSRVGTGRHCGAGATQ